MGHGSGVGSVVFGFLFSTAIAVAVVVAVALPHIRQGSRVFTPEGERFARGGAARVRGLVVGLFGRVVGAGPRRGRVPSPVPGTDVRGRPYVPGSGDDAPSSAAGPGTQDSSVRVDLAGGGSSSVPGQDTRGIDLDAADGGVPTGGQRRS